MPPPVPYQMLIVYNAEDGLFNALNDWAHKIFSPETYDCSLCRFTYGLAGMLAPWKTFVTGQPFPTVFFHRPDFWERYPDLKTQALPLILVESRGQVEVLVTADEIKNTGGLMTLINLVQSRLEGRSKIRIRK
ncbi:MAG: hypothetical protein ABIZ04_13525 [Opitutus sp.]